MSSETAHIQLREHLGFDGESYKIVKEVMSEVQPDTDNVVFFMELVTDSGNTQAYLDMANRGEITYREAFLRDNNPDLANDDEYPLIKSLSHSNWGKQITDLVYLQNLEDRSKIFSWTHMVYDRFNTLEASNYEFMYSRAGEYDTLRSELMRKGKKFTVVVEDSTDFVEQITEIDRTNSFQKNPYKEDDYRYSVFDDIQSCAILSIGRDSSNARFIRGYVQKLTGKTEVFTHFGTLHQALPKEWQEQGFRTIVEEGKLFGYVRDMYTDIEEYLEDNGISCWDLVVDKARMKELVEIVYERRRVGILAKNYVDKVGIDWSYKRRIGYYDQIIDAVKYYSPDDQAAIINKWLQDLNQALPPSQVSSQPRSDEG